jgi:GT2 family glycosyltransferase
VPETVTSPLIVGERQGFGESIEPGGFHGCFWVVPRPALDRVGLLDDRFECGYWEDDDYIACLHEAGISTRQVPSVRVKHVGGLTTVKVPEHRDWLERNEQVFKDKWGWVPPPIARYRRARESEIWHFCQNCSLRPDSDYEETPRLPAGGVECEECMSLRECQECAFY